MISPGRLDPEICWHQLLLLYRLHLVTDGWLQSMLVINSRSLLPAVGMVAGAVYSLHKRELS
ncbi:MAG: hypothetical protein AB8B32_09125, partial [Prochlorococcus sp.]